MRWLKIEREDELFAQLEREATTARTPEHSGCALPAGEDCTTVAWSPALPMLPAMKDLKSLPSSNQALLKHFRNWLHLCGYGPAGRLVYGYVVRLAFSLIDKDWREFAVETDLDRVCEYVQASCAQARAVKHLLIGLAHLREYLTIRQQRRMLPRGTLAHLAWPATQVPAPAEPDFSSILDETGVHATTQSGCVPMRDNAGRRKFVKSAGVPPGMCKPVLLVPVRQWSEPNQAFYQHFRNWLHWAGYSPAALYLYGLSVRVTLSLLAKDWREFDPAEDIEQVRDWIRQHYPNPATCASYLKGLDKLEQYLRLRQMRRLLPKSAQVQRVGNRQSGTQHPTTSGLPETIVQSVDEYSDHCRRNWLRDCADDLRVNVAQRVTRALRWLIEHGVPLQQPADLTPQLWLRYVDARLEQGITQSTLNGNLCALLGWLRWRHEQDLPIDARMLRMKLLKEARRFPRDVPVPDLRALQATIVAEAESPQPGTRLHGVMDLAWFLLMLHSGLRSGEVRRLRMGDMEWNRRVIRIEQSKGLKDRLAPMSSAVVEALNHYLVLREHEEALSDADSAAEQRIVFIDRHQPLSRTYLYERLQTYGRRCGVTCTPHRLRHSCATLLLNAGAPAASVQAILGHKWIETTLGYARVYDGTVAADYTRAMLSAEHNLNLSGESATGALSSAQMVALTDALRASGTLNVRQLDVLAILRAGLVQLVTP